MKRITTIAAAVAILTVCPRSNADTSWLIRHLATESGRVQFFTSRASANAHPLKIMYVAPENGDGFRQLRVGNVTGFAYAGINERGLTVAFSGTDPTRDRPSKPKDKQPMYTGNYIVAALLTRCGSVGQAAENLRKLAKSGYIADGMIVFLADPAQAMVFEIAPRHYATSPLGLHYTVYTNRWKLPGMEDASVRKPWELPECLQEEWAVKEAIIRERRDDGKLSVPESFAISRLNAADVKVEGIDRAASAKNTVDAYLFEMDPEYPGVLSCVYASFGPPRQTVYLPIPLGAMDALPPEVVDAVWSKDSIELHRKTPPESPVPEELAVFEKYLLQEFDDTRHQAKLLLRENKVDEAKTVLRDLLRRQTAATLEFMRGRTGLKK
jgi:hypothetical protein